VRILHFYKTYYPDSVGGVEQVINQLARGTIRAGSSVEVLSLTPKKKVKTIEIDGYFSHQARQNFQIASTPFSWSVLRYFRALANQADIVHYHFPWPFMDIVHFATMLNRPCVATYHSDIVRQKNLLKMYRPLQHCFLRSVDKIIATSPNYFATSGVLEKFKNKVSVIPIGLDRSTYPAVNENRKIYWKNILGNRFFLFVGALRYYKGLHILLDAVVGTNFPVIIVGAGPIERELKQQVMRLGLNNVKFLGSLPDEDKCALLELCYSVVFPSHLRSEAFGISLLEGAMFGKPLISSEIGTGTSYINASGETGLVVPPENPIELRQAMQFLWDNEEIASAMGHAALQRYWSNFTADQMVRSYMNLYEDVLASKNIHTITSDN